MWTWRPRCDASCRWAQTSRSPTPDGRHYGSGAVYQNLDARVTVSTLLTQKVLADICQQVRRARRSPAVELPVADIYAGSYTGSLRR